MAPSTRANGPSAPGSDHQKQSHLTQPQSQPQSQAEKPGVQHRNYARMRADSTGSTRGAFYHGTVPPNNTSANANPSPSPPVHAHNRKGKRKPPAKSAQDEREPRQSNHGPARSMADLASMAFASLGDDVGGTVESFVVNTSCLEVCGCYT
jgi:hypothetical protein